MNLPQPHTVGQYRLDGQLLGHTDHGTASSGFLNCVVFEDI